MLRTHGDRAQAEIVQHFQARLARAQLTRLRVMGYKVTCVDIAPSIDFADIVSKVHAGVFVVVDDMDFAADELRKPDSGRVTDAKIPGGINLRSGVIGH